MVITYNWSIVYDFFFCAIMIAIAIIVIITVLLSKFTFVSFKKKSVCNSYRAQVARHAVVPKPLSVGSKVQSVSQSDSQPVSRSVSQSVRQSVSLCFISLINDCLSMYRSFYLYAYEWYSQSVSQPMKCNPLEWADTVCRERVETAMSRAKEDRLIVSKA